MDWLSALSGAPYRTFHDDGLSKHCSSILKSNSLNTKSANFLPSGRLSPSAQNSPKIVKLKIDFRAFSFFFFEIILNNKVPSSIPSRDKIFFPIPASFPTLENTVEEVKKESKSFSAKRFSVCDFSENSTSISFDSLKIRRLGAISVKSFELKNSLLNNSFSFCGKGSRSNSTHAWNPWHLTISKKTELFEKVRCWISIADDTSGDDGFRRLFF